MYQLIGLLEVTDNIYVFYDEVNGILPKRGRMAVLCEENTGVGV